MSAASRLSLFLGAAMLAVVLARCSRDPRPEQFVGRWKSSRIATAPLHLQANGDWEIRTLDGNVLQYGVWQVQGKRLVWTINLNGQVQQDVNAIVAVDARSFQLRERDGSLTQFDRLD